MARNRCSNMAFSLSYGWIGIDFRLGLSFMVAMHLVFTTKVSPDSSIVIRLSVAIVIELGN